MKIAHIVSTFPPYAGGMGNATAAMARELIHLGHEVTVFTPHAFRKSPLLPPFEKGDRGGFAIRSLRPWFRFGNAALVPQLFLDLDPFDIVHLHLPFFGGAEFVWLQHQTRKAQPLVVTYHMDAIAEGWKGRFFSWHNRHILPSLLRAASRIHVTSLDYAEHSLLAGDDRVRAKLVEIPFGVDLERFQPRPSLSQSHIILFVGSLDQAHAFKGVSVLLRSLAFLLEFRRGRPGIPLELVIVGDGDLRPSYEALVRELHIEEHVTFAGRVLDEELPSFYVRADVVVLPSVSRSEAFGLVLLEAFASGKPIIASNTPGVRTLIREGENGFLVKPEDIVGLGKALDLLLSDPHRAHAMGEKGRKIAETEYRWERVGKQLDELYRSLC